MRIAKKIICLLMAVLMVTGVFGSVQVDANKTEQGMIKTTAIENFDNAVYKTPGGDDTKDKLFLMSQLEMIDTGLGFSENFDDYDVNRRCALAWDKNKKGSENDQTGDGAFTCFCWLRTPGDDADNACLVNGHGSVYSCGHFVGGYDGSFDGSCVRPALYLNLKS